MDREELISEYRRINDLAEVAHKALTSALRMRWDETSEEQEDLAFIKHTLGQLNVAMPLMEGIYKQLKKGDPIADRELWYMAENIKLFDELDAKARGRMVRIIINKFQNL